MAHKIFQALLYILYCWLNNFELTILSQERNWASKTFMVCMGRICTCVCPFQLFNRSVGFVEPGINLMSLEITPASVSYSQ